MPFTFSHPAIVLPFIRKKWFSATGLLVGTITPDFESFIRLGKNKIYSHTWPGIFWYDLPLAIIIALIFHLLVRNSLIENLPLSIRRRFERFRDINWLAYFKQHFWIVIFSMLIGITSHLLWDALTHMNLYLPDADPDPRIHWTHLKHVVWLLQYSNSVLGLCVVLWYIFKMPQTPVAQSSYRQRMFWPMLICIAILTAKYELTLIKRGLSIITYIEVAISSFCVALIIMSLLVKYVFRKKQVA